DSLPTLEKMALAIVTSARKLRPYFTSHAIEVLSTQPLRTVMQNTNQSGRLSKWVIELSEYDITYKNRTTAKSQVLADFLIELNSDLEHDLIWDLQLVANQFNGDYDTRNDRMDAYLKL